MSAMQKSNGERESPWIIIIIIIIIIVIIIIIIIIIIHSFPAVGHSKQVEGGLSL
jgi:flagellar basal body-associated protein FliL